MVHVKNKGGLWKVPAEVFEVFCIAEQILKKKQTETCSNKYGQLIGKAVLEETDELANFPKLKNEIIKQFLEELIHL